MIVILQPREHCDLGDLPPHLAAELGPLIVRVERAVDAVGEIGRVHVGRWGDGSAHLHFWFIARPARMPQLRTSFAAIWDDILPPLPEELWRANLGGRRPHARRRRRARARLAGPRVRRDRPVARRAAASRPLAARASARSGQPAAKKPLWS